jgi:hypothetical protein
MPGGEKEAVLCWLPPRLILGLIFWILGRVRVSVRVSHIITRTPGLSVGVRVMVLLPVPL